MPEQPEKDTSADRTPATHSVAGSPVPCTSLRLVSTPLSDGGLRARDYEREARLDCIVAVTPVIRPHPEASLEVALVAVVAAISLACLSTSLAQSPKHRPGHPYQAAAFEAMRLRDENGVIATNGLVNAIQQAHKMQYNANAWPGAAQPATGGIHPLVADLNTNNWEWLGPGNVGGRIRSILVHPTATNIMWIGSVGGGVWKTTNGAASWFPCDDWMANLAISCLVLDPTDPNVLYAGTGEGFGNADAIRGAGVFKSIDGGSNWSQLTSYALQNDINRLAICPTNHLLLLAATGNGLWRSVNGGTNWTQTYDSNAVKQVAFHPTNGSRAIATPDGLGL